MRRLFSIALLSVIAAGCTGGGDAPTAAPPQPTTTAAVQEMLAASDRPVVLNVWASWCLPCRSEAPLLSAAASRYEESVRFVMLNVQDGGGDAARFIDEFYTDAPLEHIADRSGNVPVDLGATRGVPLTIFYRPGGEVFRIHFGVIDERTLALQIDELLTG